MANPTDHGPRTPDPSGRRPDPNAGPPADDDSQADFALPDLADLKDFGLSDPGRLSGVNLAAEASAGSEDDWLPPLPDEPVPGSNAEFDLPPVPDDGSLFDDIPIGAGPSSDGGSLFGAAPPGPDEGSSVDAPALHVEPAFEAEDAPLAELLPAAEPESLEEAAAHDPDAADLFAPVAPGTGWFDSHAEADELPPADAAPRSGFPFGDEADLGGVPVPTGDSSNILSGLIEPAPGRSGDSSNVRLEAPGFDGTLADDDDPLAGPASGVRLDPTDAEEPLPAEFHAAPPGPFGPAPTAPQFDLSEADDIFAAAAEESPNLAGATSSIFTGLPAVTGQTDPADLADDLEDVSEAVEFSDHPDARSADSDSLRVPPELRAAAEDATEATPADGLFAAGAAAAATPARARPAPRPPSDPSVVVDWVADSDERPAARAEKSRAAREPRDRDPVRRPPAPGPVNKGAVGGMFLGLLLGGGVMAGLNYGGIWDLKPAAKTAAVATPPGGGPAGGPAQPPAALDPKAVLAAGDPAGAVKAFEKGGATTPADKTALGEARVLAWVRSPADPAGLKQAQDDLKAAADIKTPDAEPAAARAALYLGLTHELAGDRASARKVYEEGRTKFAGWADKFDAALDRLKATDPDGGKTSQRLPAAAEELLVLAAFAFVADAAPAPPAADEPAEAGPLFWKAVNAANAGKYDDAVRLVGEAKAAHEKRAKALAGKGLNPLSDPLEQIFPRSCDDLKAYWELRRTVYNHPTAGALAQKEGIAKALDQLGAAEKRATDAVKAATDLKAANDKLAADAKAAGEKAATDLRAAGEKVSAAEKELRAAKDLATKWKQETEAAMLAARKETEAVKSAALKDLEAAKATAQKEVDRRSKELEAARAEQKTAADALTAAKADGAKAADSLAAVAKALRDAKLLDDKADPAAVLAAAKLAAARASGGSDAVAAEMKDLTARASKAEAAAKEAAAQREKLDADYKAEVAKLRTAETATKDKQAADLKKLKDDQQAAVMKLQKEHNAEVKKATEGIAAAQKEVRDEMDKKVAKLQEGFLAEAKKQGEVYAATEKKLRDQAAADDKKLREGLEAERKKLSDQYAADVKKLNADLETARKKATDAEALTKKTLDDAKEVVKKVADAEALAKKATESEAATKKDFVGLAEKVKDANKQAADTREKLAAAQQEAKRLAADAEVSLAQRQRAEDQAKKLAGELKAEQERAAEVAKFLAGTLNGGPGTPAAVLPRDAAAAAARSLDAGITAYKGGRYEEAERSLAAATGANPADAVGWYFLGASRWALGRADAAREAFRRGAGAEAARVVPARVIDAAVGPIQGSARDALAAERP